MAEESPDHAAQAVRLRAAKVSLTQGAPLPTTPTIGPHSLRPSQLALLDLFVLDASIKQSQFLLLPVLLHRATMVRMSIGPVTELLLKSGDNRTIAFVSTYPPTLHKGNKRHEQWLGVKSYRYALRGASLTWWRKFLSCLSMMILMIDQAEFWRRTSETTQTSVNASTRA